VGTVLAKVAEPGRLKGEVRVSEAEARDVHRGLAVRFESGKSGVFRGRVERIDPIAVRGSVRLEVTIDDALPAGARADESVSGYIEIEKLENVLAVARPVGASDGAAAMVFRIDADDKHASRVAVRFGRGSAREVEVLGGLAEGDQIVVSDVTTPEGATVLRLQ
jgi:HlyD family secretion protein